MSSKLNIPNSITLFRGLLIYPLVIFLISKNTFYSIALIIIFFVLDILDGKLARSLNQQTSFGNNFDFFVDGTVYMIAAVILTLQGKIPNPLIIFGIICIIIKSIIIFYGVIKNHKVTHHKYSKLEGIYAFILIIFLIIHTEITIFLSYITLILLCINLGYAIKKLSEIIEYEIKTVI